MYFDRLVEAYNASGFTQKQLADKAKVSEKTINRMIKNPNYKPGWDVTINVTQALGISMQEIFAGTDVVLIRKEELAELEEAKKFVDECKNLTTENITLRENVLALTRENTDLQTKLQHKEEIISVYESHKVLLDRLARIITETSTDTQ